MSIKRQGLAPQRQGVKMTGIGSYAPETVITNDDLAQLVETSDEWIASRTGIRERHVVSGNQTVAELGIEAAKRALANAGETGEDLDLILVACSTIDTIYPALSCQVQQGIGNTRAAAFDISLACSGFAYGLTIAEQFLRTGMYKKALVVAADVHSRFTDWSDRSTCVLFGDGAGAAILEASPDDDRIYYAELHADGSRGFELTLKVNTQNCPLVEPRHGEEYPYVRMNGQEVYKFAVGTIPNAVREAVEKAGLTLDQIDKFVLHQANVRIMNAIADKLGVPAEKMVINLQKYGNTSAASIPLAFTEGLETGQIKRGDKLVLCGYGAGLAWGTVVMEW